MHMTQFSSDGARFPGYSVQSVEHNNRGLFEHVAGCLDEAAREYTSAIELDPGNAAALSNYGFLLSQQGRHAEALPWYERAIAAQPDYPLAHNNRGNSLLALGDHEGAIAAYREALLRDPTHRSALLNLAQALHVSGDLRGAAEAYDDVVKSDPNNPAALFAAAVLASTANLSRAAELLHPLLFLVPTHAEGWATLGFVCLARRDYGSAVEHCGRAVELAPEN